MREISLSLQEYQTGRIIISVVQAALVRAFPARITTAARVAIDWRSFAGSGTRPESLVGETAFHKRSLLVCGFVFEYLCLQTRSYTHFSFIYHRKSLITIPQKKTCVPKNSSVFLNLFIVLMSGCYKQVKYLALLQHLT